MNKPKLSRSGVSWTDYSWIVVDGCTERAGCQIDGRERKEFSACE